MSDEEGGNVVNTHHLERRFFQYKYSRTNDTSYEHILNQHFREENTTSIINAVISAAPIMCAKTVAPARIALQRHFM
jgi:hypothetical protein